VEQGVVYSKDDLKVNQTIETEDFPCPESGSGVWIYMYTLDPDELNI